MKNRIKEKLVKFSSCGAICLLVAGCASFSSENSLSNKQYATSRVIFCDLSKNTDPSYVMLSDKSIYFQRN